MLRLYDKQISGKWLYSFTPFQYCRRNDGINGKLDGYLCFNSYYPSLQIGWRLYLKKDGTSKLMCVFGKDNIVPCHFVVSLLKMKLHLVLCCLLTFSRIGYNPLAANAEFIHFFISIRLTDKSKVKIKYIDLCEMENSQAGSFSGRWKQPERSGRLDFSTTL